MHKLIFKTKTMKNINILKIILIFAVSSFLTSCSSDSKNSNVSSSGSNITAKIDGVSYTTVGNGTATASLFGSGLETRISFIGTDSTGNSIIISLLGITTNGTYNLNSSSDSAIEFFDKSSDTFYGTDSCDSSTGTIIITKLTSTQIEGSFSFSGNDDLNCAAAGKNVTNGSFRGVFLQT